MKMYLLDGTECKSVQEFVDYYSKKYFDRNKDIIVEKKMDDLLSAKKLDEKDVFNILAWKIDGIDKEKTNMKRKDSKDEVLYYKGWKFDENNLENSTGKSYGQSIVPLYKLLEKVKDLSLNTEVDWKNFGFSCGHGKAKEILKTLADQDIERVGSVYIITLLYFLTKGCWPIYDSQAYKAMIAIKNGHIPNKDQIDYIQQLPEKGANYPERLSRIVEDRNNQYMEYVEFLKDFEKRLPKGRRYMESRDIDRALWEYGHYFTQKKTRKYPDSYNPDLYMGDENVRYYLGNCGKKTLFCLGINPSHACEKYSDPTMNTLINIMGKKGYDSCVMINPAPYRSPKPSGLPKEADPELLKRNLEEIDKLFHNKKGSDMLCGWGDYVLNSFPWFKESLLEILKKAKQNHIRLISISVNKSGQPTHLSYMNRKNRSFDFDHGNGTYELTDYQSIF